MPVPRPGDPAPLWIAATDHNPRFVFSSLGGRWVLLGLVGSAGAPPLAQALEPLRRGGWPFDVEHCAAFLVSLDPTDREQGRIPQAIPGLRAVWDFDGAVSRAHEA